MPRKPREFFNTSFFHVMSQGINKEYIFEEKSYKNKYLKLLFENANNNKLEIITYTIMDNHSHLIINAEDVKRMSLCMKSINEQYAMYYNKKEDRVGPVFRDRFKSQPIYDEEQLYRCIIYVLRNPVKANIVNNINKYQFSNTLEDSLEKVNKILNRNIAFEEDIEKIDHNVYKFLEEDEVNSEKEIDEIIEKIIVDTKLKLKLDKIDKKDKYVMKIVINEIRNETLVSMDKIADKLGISKSTISRYLRE